MSINDLFGPPTYEEAYPEGHPDEYQVHRWDLEEKIEKVASENELLGSALKALLEEIDIRDYRWLFEYSLKTNIDALKRSIEETRNDLRVCIDDIVEEYVEFEGEKLKRRVDGILDRHARQIDNLNRWRDRYEKKP